jgi:alanine racemase
MHYRPTAITVDTDAIRHNIRLLRETIGPGTALMAVVKANAYGHGLLQSASAAVSAGASWLGVAIAEEGEQLRNAGFTLPILVLGGAASRAAAAAVANGLTQTVFDPAGVSLLQQACEAFGKTVDVHIKMDTGMGRIGVRSASQMKELLGALAKAKNVRLTGAFTHFADADGDTPDYTFRQLISFEKLSAILPGGLLLHCANSAAALKYPDARLGMVRTGIAIYGCPPVKTDLDFRPAMRFATRIVCVKEITAGDCVSYGCAFTAPHALRVATLPVGYGDGYHRAGSNIAYVLIGGTACKVIGRICMDQMMADVSHLASPRSGDEVVLLGTQGDARITADMIGQWCATISYEILLSATARVPVDYASLYH